MGMSPFFLFIWLILSLFVKGTAGKRMKMPGDRVLLNHISLSSDIQGTSTLMSQLWILLLAYGRLDFSV